MGRVEICSIVDGRVMCHYYDQYTHEQIDKLLIGLAEKYPDRVFLIGPSITARRVENGKITAHNCYA